MSWIKIFVREFTREGNSVMRFCASICPTATACMLLDQHKTLAGLDSNVLSSAERDPLLTFVLQVLHPNSHFTLDEEMRSASQTFR